jgi:glutamate-1-semialdehyde aminotransferase
MERNWSFYQPAGGVSRLGDGTPVPQILERARGAYVWDTDDRRYIDYTMGWGCALLGHGHPLVEASVVRAMGCGPTLPLPHRLEMQLSEALCQTDEIPCAEAVVFGKNGSDVCSLAIRLARLATGRSTVLVHGYHGWQDWYAEPLGFTTTGVPERHPPLVVRLETSADGDDMRNLLTAIHAHREDLAALILEPTGASGGPRMVGGTVSRDVLETVVAQARAAGALVIFDEIITGFRVPQGSVQKSTGVVPDLACFGKALGNGYPISALVGRRDHMALLSRAFYGPTFKGEIHSIAAALTALSLYRSEPVSEHVDSYGLRLQRGIEELCRRHGVQATMAGPSFRTVLHFDAQDRRRAHLMRAIYLQELLRGGIITYAGVMLPSYAHTGVELDSTLCCIDAALLRVARCCEADSEAAVLTALHRALEMPPPPPIG